MRTWSGSILAALSALAFVGPAHSHVGIQGPGFAGSNQELTFTVGHGCDGLDTRSVRIEIPSSITSVLAISSNLGKVTLERNEADLVTAVTWEQPLADMRERDEVYYKLTLRLRIPNAPFTTLVFPTTQTCSSPDGTETATALWTSTEEGHGHDDEEVGPAPVLTVLPARVGGWNKYTVPNAVSDLAPLFGDARIVWKGTAAYSKNALVAAQIAATPGVTVLAELAAGDEIWVLY